jgi:hypothetical protein
LTDELKITAWPSTPKERRWHRFLEAARKKWGYAQVPAAEVYAAFDRKVCADLSAYQHVAPGRHSQSTNSAGVVNVLRLSARKGGLYVVQYGALLTFIPTESGGALRRANTAAQLAPMLWGGPVDDADRPELGKAIGTMLDPLTDTDLINGVHTLNAAGFMEYTLSHHWARTLPRLRAWFDANASLNQLLKTARAQCEDRIAYGTHHPQPKLVVAFLLARLGHLAEAEDALQEWATTGLHKAPLSKWQDHLRRAANAS